MKLIFSLLAIGLLILMNSCDELIIKDISDKAVRVVLPVTGSALDQREVYFAWEAVAGAEDYRLMVVSPSFADLKRSVADTILNETTLKVTLPDGQYQWRIQARNSEYRSIPQVFSFTVAASGEELPESPEE